MKRAVILGAAMVLGSGCASLIGASFDDAGLVEYEAGPDVVHDASLKFDVTDAKPFDPTSLPYLVFWVDAHQQVDVNASNQVTTWHDLSGAIGRDAVDVTGYGIPTLAPTAINGQPAVHFESAGYQLLGTGFQGPGSTQFTIFLVTQGYPQSAVRFQNAVNQVPILIFPYDTATSEAAPNFELFFESTASDIGTARVTIGTTPTIAAVTFRATGTITTYSNGTLVEQRLSTASSTSNAKMWIGGFAYLLPSIFTHGDIGEVLVYDDALSDIDRSRVEGYLSVKWSIAL